MNSNEVEIRVVGRDMTGDTLDRIRSVWRQFLTWLIGLFAKTGQEAGEKLADGLWRSADGRLRDAKGKFVKSGSEAGEGFSRGFLGSALSAFSEVAFSIQKILLSVVSGSIGGVASAASAGPFGVIAVALLAIGAAAAAAMAALVALAPIVLLVGGAFGAASTAGFGLVAMIGTLALGFGGLGEAWSAYGQKSAGGGRSAAMAAREVKAATDALADAQRAALRAQEDVGRAREEEAERLEDLSRSLAGAMLDEQGAALAVQRAQERLREARKSGTGLDRAEALLGLEKAKHTLAEVQDRIADLTREKEEGDRKGVEGSDRVQSALERQIQAQRSLEAATNRLADAQRGGGGAADKFSEAMGKLSGNAQAFMRVLFGLKPAFDDLKKSVQDRLFEGMDVSFKNMATKWLPQLKDMLGGLAGNLNTVFKGIFDKISTPQFMSDIRVAVAGFGGTLERLGQGAQALLGAFGRLARASLPFWEKLADLIAGTFENFEKWIDSADESGELTKFMEDAAKSLQDIWTIGGLVIDIITELIETFMPPSEEHGGNFLDRIKETLQDVRDWLADPANQEKMRGFVDGFMDIARKAEDAILTISDWVDKIDGWVTKFEGFTDAIGALKDKIANADPFNALKESFRRSFNWIIDKWNGLEFRLPYISFLGTIIGGQTFGTPNIDRFAHGGIGGGLAMVAERGRELVHTPDGGMLLAMPHGSTVIPNGTTESMLAGGGGTTVRLEIDLMGGDEEMRRRIQRNVKVFGGGNVQVAFGTGSA